MWSIEAAKGIGCELLKSTTDCVIYRIKVYSAPGFQDWEGQDGAAVSNEVLLVGESLQSPKMAKDITWKDLTEHFSSSLFL
jgi:hypothetical protein